MAYFEYSSVLLGREREYLVEVVPDDFHGFIVPSVVNDFEEYGIGDIPFFVSERGVELFLEL